MITGMRIYDVSVAISEKTPIYEGDPKVKIETANSIARGDAANVSFLHLGAHTATHVDAPNHFIEGTSKVIDLPLDVLIGAARVVELDESVLAITPEHIENVDLNGATRVLFKTRNSGFWNNLDEGFRKDFTYFEPEAARSLVGRGIKLVGIDYLSVEKFGAETFGAHTAFLENGVVIIEGLDLREVSS
ncbi:MAG TPA: cyclase family protein, partial [Pyrinomonadaceae bacterium]|nr:cyclase family protein [Pyrinomonadaceae bacterium]